MPKRKKKKQSSSAKFIKILVVSILLLGGFIFALNSGLLSTIFGEDVSINVLQTGGGTTGSLGGSTSTSTRRPRTPVSTSTTSIGVSNTATLNSGNKGTKNDSKDEPTPITGTMKREDAPTITGSSGISDNGSIGVSNTANLNSTNTLNTMKKKDAPTITGSSGTSGDPIGVSNTTTGSKGSTNSGTNQTTGQKGVGGNVTNQVPSPTQVSCQAICQRNNTPADICARQCQQFDSILAKSGTRDARSSVEETTPKQKSTTGLDSITGKSGTGMNTNIVAKTVEAIKDIANAALPGLSGAATGVLSQKEIRDAALRSATGATSVVLNNKEVRDAAIGGATGATGIIADNLANNNQGSNNQTEGTKSTRNTGVANNIDSSVLNGNQAVDNITTTCSSGTKTFKLGHYVPTGYGIDLNGNRCESGSRCEKRECAKCVVDTNGLPRWEVQSKSCGMLYQENPGLVVLPTNAGDEYTNDSITPSTGPQIVKPKANCIDVDGSLVPTSYGRSSDAGAEYCHNGKWLSAAEYSALEKADLAAARTACLAKNGSSQADGQYEWSNNECSYIATGAARCISGSANVRSVYSNGKWVLEKCPANQACLGKGVCGELPSTTDVNGERVVEVTVEVCRLFAYLPLRLRPVCETLNAGEKVAVKLNEIIANTTTSPTQSVGVENNNGILGTPDAPGLSYDSAGAVAGCVVGLATSAVPCSAPLLVGPLGIVPSLACRVAACAGLGGIGNKAGDYLYDYLNNNQSNSSQPASAPSNGQRSGTSNTIGEVSESSLSSAPGEVLMQSDARWGSKVITQAKDCCLEWKNGKCTSIGKKDITLRQVGCGPSTVAGIVSRAKRANITPLETLEHYPGGVWGCSGTGIGTNLKVLSDVYGMTNQKPYKITNGLGNLGEFVKKDDNIFLDARVGNSSPNTGHFTSLTNCNKTSAGTECDLYDTYFSDGKALKCELTNDSYLIHCQDPQGVGRNVVIDMSSTPMQTSKAVIIKN